MSTVFSGETFTGWLRGGGRAGEYCHPSQRYASRRRPAHTGAAQPGGEASEFNRLQATRDAGQCLHASDPGYSYDALSRLREARHNPGLRTGAPDADLLRRYQYTYDLSGNRTQQKVALNGGAATTTNYTYNNANRMTAAGGVALTYDNNGNLISQGTQTYTWDHANRLIVAPTGIHYGYWSTLDNMVKSLAQF